MSTLLCCKSVLAFQKNCGEHKRSRTSGLFAVADIDSSYEEYLVSIKLLRPHEADPMVSEKGLIERCKVLIPFEGHASSYHRYTNGYYWKSPKGCQHHLHEDTTRKKKAKSRQSTSEESKYLKTMSEFPTGGTLCMKHSFGTNNVLKLENEPDIDNSMNVSHDNPAYQPSFSEIPVEQLERSDERESLLSDALNIMPPYGH